MQAFPIKTPLIQPGDNLVEILLRSVAEQGLSVEDNDIIAFASKIVAVAQNRLVQLNRIKPSSKAEAIARKYALSPEFAELVLREAEKIYGGVYKSLLTLKNGFMVVNAGVDNKNAPAGHAVLWPLNPHAQADELRAGVKRLTGRKVGVIIVDSQITPLRIGTIGVALATSGFKPVNDIRQEKDIYGRALQITRHAVADDLACAAHLLMGEKDEKTPIILIREAPVQFSDDRTKPNETQMPFAECAFTGSLGIKGKGKGKDRED